MDYWNNESAIVSTIQGEFVIISEDDIREALKLTDKKTDPRVLSWIEQRNCFLRMKYNGPITDGSLHKGKLCPQFKYLAHVMLHVFGSVSGGYDVMRKSISSLMVALILNKPLRGLKSKKVLIVSKIPANDFRTVVQEFEKRSYSDSSTGSHELEHISKDEGL